ncbi:MAG: hypothetical protein K0R65_1981 [Crocinitomicaceae bacterium]|jgi:hypothetical protein|nr:hypothetical protein [Crocinitomicaceae bacterium]
MSKLLTPLFCLALTFPAFTQKVITVKGRHSKTLIHTFKKGEYLSRGEARIHIKASGAGYEFCTTDENYRYYLYKNGQNLGEYAGFYFTDDSHTVKLIRKGDERFYTLTLKSGEKFGPYESVGPVYDYSTYDITGIRYKQNGQYYLRNLTTGKTYGPHPDFSINILTKGEMTYTYKDDRGFMLVHNDKTYGPYANLSSEYYYGNGKPKHFYFHYKTENDEWRTHFEGSDLPRSFKDTPKIGVFENGKVMQSGVPAGSESDTVYYFIDERRYAEIPYRQEIECNSFGEVLTAKMESSSSDSPALIYDEGKELGKYKRLYLPPSNCHNSPYFQCLFANPESGEVFIYGNQKFVRLGTEEEINNYEVHLLGQDYYFIRKTDQVLIKNGQETGNKNMKSMDASNYPEIILHETGAGFDRFYRNGKKLSYNEVAQYKRNPQWYNLEDSPLRFVENDGKTYLIAKGSGKKYGPVKRYNEFRFSRGNAHLAECDNRQMQIFIDNKLFSPGFSLEFHEKENAFYWLSTDKNKLYLHTYQND